MKSKWLISVKDGSLGTVTNELKKLGVKSVETLESIGVIMVVPTNQKMADIKKINGVLSVEEERDVNI
ncbi:hypothetical protein QWY86_07175 [Pedobacter aquatilis]|uniref:hypothetical protein n=1 Tax=Pedobacter aquatilis TaxID=351343 RepID=UPI0025B3E507|nr:hypothetical protein [Pedobacter aquatilis]MDN3586438.1 hypothetical protein [Pedobacter aquatilis]